HAHKSGHKRSSGRGKASHPARSSLVRAVARLYSFSLACPLKFFSRVTNTPFSRTLVLIRSTDLPLNATCRLPRSFSASLLFLEGIRIVSPRRTCSSSVCHFRPFFLGSPLDSSFLSSALENTLNFFPSI